VPEARVYGIDDIVFSDLEGKAIIKPANRHEYWFVVEKEFHFNAAMETYKQKGIDEVMVQRFVKGEDVKFYAIGNRVIIPKSAKENFPEKTIKEIEKNVLDIEKATGLKILGGDFVVDPKDDYKVYCVDINDWPTFSVIGEFSQEEAGAEIANLIFSEFEKHKKNN
jgi:D-alanine-D-alanine ligase-like ATP-grasp enzyme